jgi:hypothetical protein
MGISELGQEISTVEQWISASDKMMYSDKEKREKTQV